MLLVLGMVDNTVTSSSEEETPACQMCLRSNSPVTANKHLGCKLESYRFPLEWTKKCHQSKWRKASCWRLLSKRPDQPASAILPPTCFPRASHRNAVTTKVFKVTRRLDCPITTDSLEEMKTSFSFQKPRIVQPSHSTKGLLALVTHQFTCLEDRNQGYVPESILSNTWDAARQLLKTSADWKGVHRSHIA